MQSTLSLPLVRIGCRVPLFLSEKRIALKSRYSVWLVSFETVSFYSYTVSLCMMRNNCLISENIHC